MSQSEIAALKDQLSVALDRLDKMKSEEFAQRHAKEAAERELTAMAARCGVLTEALEQIAESHDAGRHDGLPEPCPAHGDVEMWSIANEALTSLPARAAAMGAALALLRTIAGEEGEGIPADCAEDWAGDWQKEAREIIAKLDGAA